MTVIRGAQKATGRSTHIDANAFGLPEEFMWGSSIHAFVEDIWPHLPPVAVVVSHGNLMRQQICGRVRKPKFHVPNGGVIQLERGGRVCFFVRHCTTCHNIDKQGSNTATVCHNFDTLASATKLVASLKNCGLVDGVYCSALPRAILTAIALQRKVNEKERLAFAQVFGSCSVPILPGQVKAYMDAHSCIGAATSPFCATSPLQAEQEGNGQES